MRGSDTIESSKKVWNKGSFLMKKNLWSKGVPAVLLALGLAYTGCDNGTTTVVQGGNALQAAIDFKNRFNSMSEVDELGLWAEVGGGYKYSAGGVTIGKRAGEVGPDARILPSDDATIKNGGADSIDDAVRVEIPEGKSLTLDIPDGVTVNLASGHQLYVQNGGQLVVTGSRGVFNVDAQMKSTSAGHQPGLRLDPYGAKVEVRGDAMLMLAGGSADESVALKMDAPPPGEFNSTVPGSTLIVYDTGYIGIATTEESGLVPMQGVAGSRTVLISETAALAVMARSETFSNVKIPADMISPVDQGFEVSVGEYNSMWNGRALLDFGTDWRPAINKLTVLNNASATFRSQDSVGKIRSGQVLGTGKVSFVDQAASGTGALVATELYTRNGIGRLSFDPSAMLIMSDAGNPGHPIRLIVDNEFNAGAIRFEFKDPAMTVANATAFSGIAIQPGGLLNAGEVNLTQTPDDVKYTIANAPRLYNFGDANIRNLVMFGAPQAADTTAFQVNVPPTTGGNYGRADTKPFRATKLTLVGLTADVKAVRQVATGADVTQIYLSDYYGNGENNSSADPVPAFLRDRAETFSLRFVPTSGGVYNGLVVEQPVSYDGLEIEGNLKVQSDLTVNRITFVGSAGTYVGSTLEVLGNGQILGGKRIVFPKIHPQATSDHVVVLERGDYRIGPDGIGFPAASKTSFQTRVAYDAAKPVTASYMDLELATLKVGANAKITSIGKGLGITGKAPTTPGLINGKYGLYVEGSFEGGGDSVLVSQKPIYMNNVTGGNFSAGVLDVRDASADSVYVKAQNISVRDAYIDGVSVMDSLGNTNLTGTGSFAGSATFNGRTTFGETLKVDGGAEFSGTVERMPRRAYFRGDLDVKGVINGTADSVQFIGGTNTSIMLQKVKIESGYWRNSRADPLELLMPGSATISGAGGTILLANANPAGKAPELKAGGYMWKDDPTTGKKLVAGHFGAIGDGVKVSGMGKLVAENGPFYLEGVTIDSVASISFVQSGTTTDNYFYVGRLKTFTRGAALTETQVGSGTDSLIVDTAKKANLVVESGAKLYLEGAGTGTIGGARIVIPNGNFELKDNSKVIIPNLGNANYYASSTGFVKVGQGVLLMLPPNAAYTASFTVGGEPEVDTGEITGTGVTITSEGRISGRSLVASGTGIVADGRVVRGIKAPDSTAAPTGGLSLDISGLQVLSLGKFSAVYTGAGTNGATVKVGTGLMIIGGLDNIGFGAGVTLKPGTRGNIAGGETMFVQGDGTLDAPTGSTGVTVTQDKGRWIGKRAAGMDSESITAILKK